MTADIHVRLQDMLADMRGDWVLTRAGSGWYLESGVRKKAVASEVAQLARDRGLIEVFRSQNGIVQYCPSPTAPRMAKQ